MNLVLNDRQKDILEQMGLPTDVEDLTSSQKYSIKRIESMLCYLEETYGGTFCYVGYTSGKLMDTEQLMAYPKDHEEQVITLTTAEEKDGKYTYDDNYAEVLAKDYYVEDMADILNDALGCDSTAYAFAGLNIYECSTDWKELSKDSVCGALKGEGILFLNASAVSADQFDGAVDKIRTATEEKELGLSIQVILLTDDSAASIDEENYTDYLDENHYSKRVDL